MGMFDMGSGLIPKDVLFGTSGVGPSIALFNKLSAQQAQMLNQATGFQQLGINQIQRGFDRARTGVKQASGVAKQESRDIATSALGASKSSAISRGLFNTSTFDAVNRGIGSDLMRHLSSIDAMTSQQLGGLDTQQAGALAQGYGQMGNLYTQFGQNQAALAGPLFGAVGQGTPGILGPLIGGMGMGMGMGMFGSDPRLKKNIEFEGMLDVHRTGEKIPVYSYNYKNPDIPERYLGVMATDVMHLGVVSKSSSGYLQVDYIKLEKLTGFRFKKIAKGEKVMV